MRRQITSEELTAVMHAIGSAVWHLQYTEDALHTFLTVKVEIGVPGSVPPERARELLAKSRRATLGTALRISEQHAVFPTDLAARLRGLKEERDWLVHRSWHEHGELLHTSEGRDSFFSRVQRIEAEANALRSAMLSELEVHCRSHGVNIEAAHRMAKERVATLRGDA